MSLVKLAATNEEVGFTPGGIWAGRGIGGGIGAGLGAGAGALVSKKIIAELERQGLNLPAGKVRGLATLVGAGAGLLGGASIGGWAARAKQVHGHAKAEGRKHPIASTLLARRDWEDTYAATKPMTALKTLSPGMALRHFIHKTVREKN